MFFNSLKSKLKKSYTALNPEIGRMIFPNGESEYIYVGTMLNTLFNKRNVFELIKIYASVYSYYQSTVGNAAKSYSYAKKKATSILNDGEIKNLLALIMLNLTAQKANISDPISAIRQYRDFIDSYLQTVEVIKQNEWRFKPNSVDAGTASSPLLVAGIDGVHDYINTLSIPDVEKITFKRTSSLHLTDEICKVDYAIDEYTLYNAKNSAEIAKLWFNIYGTENTTILPACLSIKEPFTATKIIPELFDEAVKELKNIEEITKNAQIQYDFVNFVTATFAYYYIIWLFSFKGIRGYQADEVEKGYIDGFIAYAKEAFENAPYKRVVESGEVFKAMLKRVDLRVRNSYHANNHTLVDDGLSNEFLLEFIADATAAQKIQPLISKRIMEDWVLLGQNADDKYLT